MVWGARLEAIKTFVNFTFFSEDSAEEPCSGPRRHSAPDILEGAASHQASYPDAIVYGQGYAFEEEEPAVEHRSSEPVRQPAFSFDEHRAYDDDDDEDDEDDDGLLMVQTSSMKSTTSTTSTSSSFSTSTVDTLREAGHHRSSARKHRPCKQKRMRLKRLTTKLINQYIAGQTGSGWADVALPQSLIEDRKLFLKVMKEVHEGVRQYQMEQQQGAQSWPLSQWAR